MTEFVPQTVPHCAVCEAPSWAVLELQVTIQPAWSLVPEDMGEQWARLGLCRECSAKLASGDDLKTEMYVEYVPGTAKAKATA